MSRLYDVDGDGVASKAEVEHITKVMRGFIISLTYVCVQDRRSQCWTNLDITQVLTEPIVAGRLYGGMMERVADEVRS